MEKIPHPVISKGEYSNYILPGIATHFCRNSLYPKPFNFFKLSVNV